MCIFSTKPNDLHIRICLIVLKERKKGAIITNCSNRRKYIQRMIEISNKVVEWLILYYDYYLTGMYQNKFL